MATESLSFNTAIGETTAYVAVPEQSNGKSVIVMLRGLQCSLSRGELVGEGETLTYHCRGRGWSGGGGGAVAAGGEVAAEVGDLVLQLDDALRPGEGHAFTHQADQGGDVVQLGTAVAPLPACRPGRATDTLAVQATHERRLHGDELGGLTDGVERGVVVGRRRATMHSAGARRRRPAPLGHDAVAPAGSRESSLELVSIAVDW